MHIIVTYHCNAYREMKKKSKKKSVTAEIQPEYNQNTTKYKQIYCIQNTTKIQPKYIEYTKYIVFVRGQRYPYSGAKVLAPD